MENEGKGWSFGRLATWVIIAVVALLAVKLAFVALGVALFLLFRILPLLLVGWLILKLWRWIQSKPAAGE